VKTDTSRRNFLAAPGFAGRRSGIDRIQFYSVRLAPQQAAPTRVRSLTAFWADGLEGLNCRLWLHDHSDPT